MNKSVLIFLFSLLCNLSCFAQNDSIPFDLGKNPYATCSIYIENLLTGDVLVDINGDMPLIPASVTKLVTAATVLENHPKDFRYSTKVYITGSVCDSVLLGNLLIKPSGDPTLESIYFPEQNGFADSIVCVLKRMGIRKISGNIVIEEDKSLEELPPSGWMETDLPWYYGTGYHAVNFRDNCFVLSLPDKSSIPHVPNLQVALTKRKGKLEFSRKRDSATIYVSGRLPKRGVKERLANPHPKETLEAEIENKLSSSGIEIKRLNERSGQETLILNHQSAPLIEILRSMMHRSDNMMAEAMLKLSAPGMTRKIAAEKEMALWQERKVDIFGLSIEDGSGLSRDNRLSAYFLADILAWKGLEHLDFDFVELFPRCGEQGTVKNLLKDSCLQGKVALKSGSMSGVRCYAGYSINEDGMPTHIIVIMVNNFKGNTSQLKKEIENLLLENIF